MSNKRNIVIDIMKAIGIFLVVLGHTVPYDSAIRRYIYIFHLPLFFVVSGYLYNSVSSKKPWEYIGKKLYSFFKLFVFYGIFLLLFHNVFFKLGILENSFSYTIKDFIVRLLNTFLFQSNESFSGPLWFVPVLFVSLVIYNFITHFIYREEIWKSEIYRSWAVVFCALLGIYLTSRGINIGLGYQISFLVIPFIHFGQIYKLYLKDRLKPDIVIALFIVLNSIGFFLNVDGDVDIAYGRIWNPILFYILVPCMIYSVYTFSYYISIYLKRISNALAHVGENSFHIMALHVMFFKLFDLVYYYIFKPSDFNLSLFPISSHKYFIIYTIFSIICSLIFVKVVGYIKKFVSRFKFY